MTKGSRAEIKCGACDGSGSLPSESRSPAARSIRLGARNAAARAGSPSPNEYERGERPFAFDAALRNGCQSETRSRSQRVAN